MRREPLIEIFTRALADCSPVGSTARVFRAQASTLPEYDGLWIFGVGKAAASMAQGMMGELAPAEKKKLRGGALIIPTNLAIDQTSFAPLQIFKGTHPHPSDQSVNATRDFLNVLGQCGPKDHAVFLISGGASALLTFPSEGIPVVEKAMVARELMVSGASIHHLNTVRKHLSEVKGGKLRKSLQCGATAFILSDVFDDDISVVGSGPLAEDHTTPDDALAIVMRRLKPKTVPYSVRACLEQGRGKILSVALPRIAHHLVANPVTLARSAVFFAEEKLKVTPDSNVVRLDQAPITQNVMDVALEYCTEIRAAIKAKKFPSLIVRFGEPTVAITSIRHGRGGRSQHLALLIARELAGVSGWRFLAAGSDGIDGNSDAAGAVVDGRTWLLAEESGLRPENALENFDSYTVHKALKTHIFTGPTGNNLLDLHLIAISGIDEA